MAPGPAAPDNWMPSCGRDALVAAATLRERIRGFFVERGVLEVDTPLLCSTTATDPHLASFPVSGSRWLQTSPEFCLKRLVAAGYGPVFQLAKAFRKGEAGRRHNPEFTLLEWYRPGFDEVALMDEVATLVGDCLGTGAIPTTTYRALFERSCGVNPHAATREELAAIAAARIEIGALPADRDDLLDLLFSHLVEPELAARGPLFVRDFPAGQAALAEVGPSDDGDEVARRFELYVGGIELANGYRELLDADEQARRFRRDNRRRRELDLPEVPLDDRLLAALGRIEAPCAGVALGFERLLMLVLGETDIAAVLAFPYARC